MNARHIHRLHLEKIKTRNKKPVVLIATPENQFSESIIQCLQKRNYGVSVAKTYSKAEHFLETIHFDAILIDPLLEKTKGLHLIEFLQQKNGNQNSNTPIALICSSGSKEFHNTYKDKIKWFIIPPLMSSDLVSKLENFIFFS